MSRFNKILKIIPIILGALLIGANLFWAPVCSGKLKLMNGTLASMKCFYTGKASIIFAIIIIIVAIQDLLQKKISWLFYIGVGIVLILLPSSTYGIGVCKMEGMACGKTALWIRGIGVASILYSIASLFIKDSDQVPM